MQFGILCPDEVVCSLILIRLKVYLGNKYMLVKESKPTKLRQQYVSGLLTAIFLVLVTLAQVAVSACILNVLMCV